MLPYGRELDYKVGVFTNPENTSATQISNLGLRYDHFSKARQQSPKFVNIKLLCMYVIYHTLQNLTEST